MTARPTGMHEQQSQAQQLGKYQRVATLGQGGMGTVHLALANGFGHFRKLIVVKELRQDLTRQKGFISLFMDEAKLAARLSHPNVVETFEAIHEGTRYFLTMEYLDGQPLSALIKRLAKGSEQLPLGMHVRILCEVLSGLHYAHELQDYDGTSLQVVHRDVSPQNVFLTYHGEVKVVDFGVAKAANASVNTAPGVFVGKFGYAAPEQVLGGNVDARTDVFAVGVMLWQAIAERRFSSSTPTPEAFRARAQGSEPRIVEVVKDVDPKLAAICDRALAVDPEQRFPTAHAFRAALQEHLLEQGTHVEAAEIGELMRRVFEAERRALHRVIEAAVHTHGTPAGSAPMNFLESLDTEPTAVADLSNLVDVSLQRDEQKIREGAAHTVVARLLTPSKSPQAPELVAPAPAIEPPPPAPPPVAPAFAELSAQPPRRSSFARFAPLALAALCACVLGAFYLAARSDAPEIHAKPLPALAAGSSAVAPQTTPAPAPPLQAPIVSQPKAASPAHGARTAAASQANSVLPPSAAAPVRAAHPIPAAGPASAPAARPAAAAPPRPAAVAPSGTRVEAGADLGVPRRPGTIRIDLDDPYQ